MCAILCDLYHVLVHITVEPIFEEVIFFSLQENTGFFHQYINLAAHLLPGHAEASFPTTPFSLRVFSNSGSYSQLDVTAHKDT